MDILSSSSGDLSRDLTDPGCAGEPSKLYEAQERAVLQEYHFILKKILDRVQKKTAQDADATAAAKATASAALAAVPGGWSPISPETGLKYESMPFVLKCAGAASAFCTKVSGCRGGQLAFFCK
jgi:hypothetical protein